MKSYISLFVLVSGLVLSACDSLPMFAAPTATPTQTPTLTSTAMPTPTATIPSSPTVTSTPSLTPPPTQIPIADYELLRVLEGQGMDTVRNISFSPDGTLLVAGSQDATIRVWNVSDGRLYRRFPNNSGINWSVAFSPDGKVIASSFWNNPEIQLWDLSNGSVVRRLGTDKAFNRSLAFSPDGKELLSFASNPQSAVELRSVVDGNVLQSIEAMESFREGVFSPDGKLIVASTNESNDIFIWRVQDSVLLHRINQRDSGYNQSNVQISFTHDGSILAAADRNKVNLWDLETETINSTYQIDTGETFAELFFSPDDRYLFGLGEVIGYFSRTKLYIWDVQENKLLRTIERKDFDDSSAGGLSLAAMSPDGKYLAIGYIRIFIFGLP